ncbi:carbonic anhydrase 5B, mitochondrial-like [Gorilla gorilla gorilla]|uniref:carbonic anhydrase 5B, mitochondrial-like n=1 Tax=Gorilla gorilla gorilla TaxID=9595 RepID=UPI002446346B|nr:carbonic anhydrase 5B, mitochondrial-like [Gorilla gorilla gorilla]
MAQFLVLEMRTNIFVTKGAYSGYWVPASFLGTDQSFRLQHHSFRIDQGGSMGTPAFGKNEENVHPLWESVDLVPGGDRQSPINIRWRDSVYDPGLKPLTISYDPATCLHVWNNGYSFLVEFEDSTDKSGCTRNMVLTSASGEGLKLFPLMLEGQGEPTCRDHMLHLVHWNAVKFENFEDAALEENGLAVIGVFLKISETSGSPVSTGRPKPLARKPRPAQKHWVLQSRPFLSSQVQENCKVTYFTGSTGSASGPSPPLLPAGTTPSSASRERWSPPASTSLERWSLRPGGAFPTGCRC